MSRTVTASDRQTTDATGSVLLRITGPIRHTDRWNLRTLTVTSVRVGDGTFPTASVFRSIESDAYLIGTSRAADSVTFEAVGDWLLSGDTLLVRVENAAAASTSTATLSAVEVRE